jgi:hypothetical protein
MHEKRSNYQAQEKKLLKNFVSRMHFFCVWMRNKAAAKCFDSLLYPSHMQHNVMPLMPFM